MKARDVRLNWRKTGPGHYEEQTYGFAITADKGRYEVLDPAGKVIYRPASMDQAFGVFEAIPSHPGDLVTDQTNANGLAYAWHLSEYPWEITDYSLLHDPPYGKPDLSVLPPMSLPQEIRAEFMWGWDSLKNAYHGVVYRLHPKLLEQYACRYCRLPALTDNICPVCVLIDMENTAYRKTLYKEE